MRQYAQNQLDVATLDWQGRYLLRKLFMAALLAGGRAQRFWRDTVTGTERRIAEQLLTRHFVFWARFILQLERMKRLQQPIGPREEARIARYVLPARGALEWAEVVGADSADRITWQLGAPQEGARFAHGHCPDCVQLAAAPGFTQTTLRIVPGEGRTRCQTRCTCTLKFTRPTP